MTENLFAKLRKVFVALLSVLCVFSICAFFVACNKGSDETEPPTYSYTETDTDTDSFDILSD